MVDKAHGDRLAGVQHKFQAKHSQHCYEISGVTQDVNGMKSFITQFLGTDSGVCTYSFLQKWSEESNDSAPRQCLRRQHFPSRRPSEGPPVCPLFKEISSSHTLPPLNISPPCYPIFQIPPFFMVHVDGPIHTEPQRMGTSALTLKARRAYLFLGQHRKEGKGKTIHSPY